MEMWVTPLVTAACATVMGVLFATARLLWSTSTKLAEVATIVSAHEKRLDRLEGE